VTYGSSDAELTTYPTVFRPDLFRDQVVLVSGGGSGLGKATAVLLARLGARLVICGRDAEKLERSADVLRGLGAEVLTCPMTIRDPEQVDRLFTATCERFGKLDVLVNNAGGQFGSPAMKITPKGWNAVVDTNLNGTWHMMQRAAKLWESTGTRGNIVNVVTVIWRGQPQVAHTCAARAGVVYLSKSVAVEWAPLGIRVNCVAPGCVETTAFELYSPEGRSSFYEANPMRRAGDEYDIAEAICYLAAPSGKFITGEVITVDGGQQCWGEPWFAGRPAYFDPQTPAPK
jgi:citronellol/citronellal dehydrogenase